MPSCCRWLLALLCYSWVPLQADLRGLSVLEGSPLGLLPSSSSSCKSTPYVYGFSLRSLNSAASSCFVLCSRPFPRNLSFNPVFYSQKLLASTSPPPPTSALLYRPGLVSVTFPLIIGVSPSGHLPTYARSLLTVYAHDQGERFCGSEEGGAAAWPQFYQPTREERYEHHRDAKELGGTTEENLRRVREVLDNLDEQFKKTSFLTVHRTAAAPTDLLQCGDRWADTNRQVLLSLREERELRMSSLEPQGYFKVQAFTQALSIMRKYRSLVPYSCSAVALAVLRAEGVKHTGEERYYLRHGYHRSSVLNAIEQAIVLTGASGREPDGGRQ
eukprot:GHVS01016072.1.p1 GENE.GHVS01016072.1~~GHVS01016072.1.p1  ORF type:complete len:329 (+),score=44.73 GHVS01016072.1:827-1813(+)